MSDFKHLHIFTCLCVYIPSILLYLDFMNLWSDTSIDVNMWHLNSHRLYHGCNLKSLMPMITKGFWCPISLSVRYPHMSNQKDKVCWRNQQSCFCPNAHVLRILKSILIGDFCYPKNQGIVWSMHFNDSANFIIAPLLFKCFHLKQIFPTNKLVGHPNRW